MRLDNKIAILGDKWGGHKIRPHTEGGKEGGDAGEPTPARDYRLTQMPLTRKQFEFFVGESAFNVFFNESASKPLEPAFDSFKTLWVDNVYTKCAVTFFLGNTNTKEVTVDGAKIKGLSIKFKKGCNERACAELSCTVQACFPRNLTTLDMEQFVGNEIKASLRFGPVEEETGDEKAKQTDLVEKAREDEEEEEARKSRRDNGNDAARAH